MAHSNIYICDSCSSIINEDDIYFIEFGRMSNLAGRMPDNLRGKSLANLNREICSVCIDELITKFRLAEFPGDLRAKAFANFELPKKLEFKHDHQWHVDPENTFYDICELCGETRYFEN